jgi:hypothetical protein
MSSKLMIISFFILLIFAVAIVVLSSLDLDLDRAFAQQADTEQDDVTESLIIFTNLENMDADKPYRT